MAIENQIAQFGMDAGRNIQNTVGNAMARAENRRRYDTENQYRNRMADFGMQKYQNEQKQAADAAREKAEFDLASGFVSQWDQAPEDARPYLAQGYRQKALKAGYMAPEEAQQPIDDEYVYRLKGHLGIPHDDAMRTLPAGLQEFNAMAEGLSQEDQLKARRISLGLDPRQGFASPKNITIGDVPYTFDPQTQTYTPAVVGGKEVTPEDVGGNKAIIAGAEKEGAETGKGMGAYNMAQYEAANASVDNIAKIDNLVTHLETSDAITGMGAEFLKNIERAKALLGSDVAAGKVADTEILDTMMGSEVFPLIKALGVGARGLDTPAEREFMRNVLTGAIPLNKETLIEMAKTRRSIAERAINKWNSRTENGELDRFYEATGIPKEKIRIESNSSNQTQAPATSEDQQALEWAKANPNDPRAQQILQLHGVK